MYGTKSLILLALCLFFSNDGNAYFCAEQPVVPRTMGANARIRTEGLESGNLDQAESYFKTALSQAKGLGYAGPLTTSLHHLGKVLYLKKQYPEAEANYKEALEIYDEQPRRNSTVLMQLVKDYAKLLRETGRESEAVEQEARIKSPTHRAE